MKGYVCKICGFVSINGSAPEKCPVCGAPKSSFEDKADALKTSQDDAKAGEKHAPVIVVVKKCGLIPEGCNDVHVKVGEVQHPMLPEHYITNIDFYIDGEYISRVYLTPDKLNPAAALHLKATSGKLSAVEHCNQHGSWIQEASL